MIRFKLGLLAVCLTFSVVFMALSAKQTAAYFSEAKGGTMTGTLGVWSKPYDLKVGTSTARHLIPGKCSYKITPIAYLDQSSTLCLDYGDLAPGDSLCSSDVFRILSQSNATQAVSFRVIGAASLFMRRIELSNHSSAITPYSTVSISTQFSVPRRQAKGVYVGQIVLTVDGQQKTIPVTVTVTMRATEPKPGHLPQSSPHMFTPAPISTPATPTPALTPSESPEEQLSPLPEPSQTPPVTPAATPH